MTTYYANNELQAFRHRKGNYKQEHDVWKESKEKEEKQAKDEKDKYDKDHADWLKLDTNEQGVRVDKNGLPVPEPQPPQPGAVPPEPDTLENDLTVYTARELEGPEELQMPEGIALIFPPSIILTDGENSFAVTPDVLVSQYTSTEIPIGEAILPKKEKPEG